MTPKTAAATNGFVITESRPSEVLASLHESAEPEREYLFAARDADPDDLVLVAWIDETAVGYVAVTDQRENGVLIWEHLIVPSHRGQGLGRLLLAAVARRAVPGAIMEVDPLSELDIERVADYYRRLGFSHTTASGRVWATVSEVLTRLSEDGRMSEQFLTLQDLLSDKAPGVITVQPETTVRSTIDLLNQHHIGAVVVSTDGSRVEGIVSERDVLVGLSEDGEIILDRPVVDLVTPDVVTATTSDSIMSAMDSMTKRRIRHLPVTSTGRLAGIISVGDLVNFRLQAVEEMLRAQAD